MDNSPLARLPPELRNRIYEQGLTYDADLFINKVIGHTGLCQTCAQLRKETKGMFYTTNHFALEGRHVSLLADLLLTLGTETVVNIPMLWFRDAGYVRTLRIVADKACIDKSRNWPVVEAVVRRGGDFPKLINAYNSLGLLLEEVLDDDAECINLRVSWMPPSTTKSITSAGQHE